MPSSPWLDSSLSVRERAGALLARMTPAEKIGQLCQMDARLDVEHLVRELHVGTLCNCQSIALVRRVQEIAAGETRLGIPVLFGMDAVHGHAFFPGATVFPSPLALSSSWDPGLLEEVGRVTAREMTATGSHLTFAPVLDLPWDLRWGRVDESFGEDPLLIGDFGAAAVRGLQGGRLSDADSVIACPKHFAAYGASAGGRDAGEADVGRRRMLAEFLPPFERAVRAGCGAIMIAYHAVDGVPCATNPWLLGDVLRRAWGFRGFSQTDWENADALVDLRRTCADHAEAYRRALEAGCDVFCSAARLLEHGPGWYERGLLPAARVDEACRRVLEAKLALGLFDRPDKRLPDAARAAGVLASAEHRDAALRAARAGLVLLKNDGVLPLARGRLRRLAVLGPNADDPVSQLGDWSWGMQQGDWDLGPDHPRSNVATVLDGIRAWAADAVEVLHHRGCDALPARHLAMAQIRVMQIPRAALRPGPSDLAAAAALAARSDLAIAVVGDSLPTFGEQRDRADLGLPGEQQRLLEMLKATGRPLVVVLLCSKPHVVPWIAEHANAVLLAHNPGMAGGRAIAEVLAGEIEPSGRLTMSWPRHLGTQPVTHRQVPGWHGAPTYLDVAPDPLFAFGEGLGYTTFSCGEPKLERARLSSADTAVVEVEVANTGPRPGSTVVQLYADDLVASVTRPARELKAYRRVALAPGERRTVRLEVPCGTLAIVGADLNRVVEPGDFDLLAGLSSRPADLKSVRLTVTA